ncbi:MAG: nitrile hydratase accessory protein [Rhodospirillales bacterium]|nr:nitrile hydratase accessory protein [Rhodospirillales bacterium]
MSTPLQPGLPNDDTAPRFEAPWQARIFAAVVSLADAGCFRWEEFQQRLIAEVGRGDGDPGRYYAHWLAAVEKLLTEKGLLTSDRLAGRIAALRPPRPSIR